MQVTGLPMFAMFGGPPPAQVEGKSPKTRPLVGSRRAPADRPRVWRGLPQV